MSKALCISLSLLLQNLFVSGSLLPSTIAWASEMASCLPTLGDDEAWSRLPPLVRGERQALPVWARMLADSLPRTTAAMLELDALHRARSPLGAMLAAKVRQAVAEANHCAYSTACAQADLTRQTETDAGIAPGAGGFSATPEAERLILAFSGRLTLEADTITDDEVACLTDLLTEQRLVALVLLVAHANFQDRLFLALGNVADLGEPLPPLAATFAKPEKDNDEEDDDEIDVPVRDMPDFNSAPAVPDRVEDPEWRALDFAALKRNMEAQKERSGRIRVPAWEEVVGGIPADQRPDHPIRILWTLVCRGYQPALAAGWSDCLRSFTKESQQDRVFEESVFWVITRTIHCFY